VSSFLTVFPERISQLLYISYFTVILELVFDNKLTI